MRPSRAPCTYPLLHTATRMAYFSQQCGLLEACYSSGSGLFPSLGFQIRALNDAEFPHTFLVSGKQRTLELQAR